MCQISIVTSIYNGEKYIAETIESVINQTFTDWEYIIMDNASEDRSAEIIEEYARKDPRIRLYRNEKNLGPYPSLDKGYAMASGRYIAHLDADDLCATERLRKQFDYMEAHPEIALLGSGAESMENGQLFLHEELFPTSPEEARFSLFFDNLLPHSSHFLRKDFMKTYNIQYGDYCYCGDYKRTLDILRTGNVMKYPERLITYRYHSEQATARISKQVQLTEAAKVSLDYLETLPTGYHEIFKKALLGGLKSLSDIRTFDAAFASYAEMCGVKNFKSSECVKEVYRRVLSRQNGSVTLLCGYIRSPFRDRPWPTKRKHFSIIKHCLIHRKGIGVSELLKV